MGQARANGRERMLRRERRLARWADVLLWVYAIGSASAVVLVLFGRIGRSEGPSIPEFLYATLNVPLFPSLASVAVLVLVTGALMRRKRAALIVVGLFQVLGGLYSLLVVGVVVSVVLGGGADLLPEGALRWRTVLLLMGNALSPLVAVLALVQLVRLRPLFPGRLARGSRTLAAAVLVSGTIVSIAVTYLLLLLDGHRALEWRVLAYAVLRAFGVVEGHRFAHVPAWIPWVTGLLMGASILLAAWVFLRSENRREHADGEQAIRLRTLLAEYGDQDSLGYFATRRDKDLLFSPDGSAAIAYAVRDSVCIAAGDPIGPPSAWPGVIAAFLARCRANGWVPAVLSSGEQAARAWADAGMVATPMGDEAVLSADRFDLANTSMTPVRRAVAHAERAGLSVSVRRHSSLSAQEREQMIRLTDAWRTGGEERGFSMALGRLGDPADGSMVLVVAEDAEGAWKGLLSFVPWGAHGVSLDVMRRAPDAPGGVNELMVAALLQRGGELGIRRVSLNFAMFRGVFEDAEKVGANPATRVLARVLRRLEGRFQLESLYRSNQKYHPEWVPRFLLVDSVLNLPRTALSAGVLEGFLPDLRGRRQPVEEGFTPQQLERIRRLEERRVQAADLEPARSDQSRHRVRHLRELREAGMEPYPIGLPSPQPFGTMLEAVERGEATGEGLRVAARVRRLRSFGGVCFADLVDGAQSLQVVLERGAIGAESLRLWRRCVDVGDIVQLQGRPGHSRTGTPSLLVTHWCMASKALQPIPFGAFEDPESRLRRRSTDLIVHPREAGLLRARSIVVRAVREHLQQAGYLEVETPILQAVHGGANARPFRTRINAYASDLTLRIAPELALKRLLVGGMGAIFEIGRNFRNEGADATHNPEFTVVEAYRPYADYHAMRRLTEAMIKAAARAVYGAEVLPLRNVRTGEDLAGRPTEQQQADPARRLHALLTDVSGPWAVVSVCEAVSRAVGREVTVDTDIDVLLELATEHQVHVRDDMGPGAVIEELYGELVEERTVRPTFYVDFPAETSPLTGPHRSAPGLVERWDLVICGMEIGTAYSELADPLEQRRRLTEQSLKAAAGDPEAMQIDEDFLAALENAMPPAGGLGIGLDRLVMLLTDTSIREILAFPFVRPERRD